MWEQVKLSTKVFSLGFGGRSKLVCTRNFKIHVQCKKWLRTYDTHLDGLCPSQIASFLPKTSFPVATYHLKLTRRNRGLLKSKPKGIHNKTSRLLGNDS